MIRRQVMTGALKLFDLLLLITSFGVAARFVLVSVGPTTFSELLAIKIKLQNFVVFSALLWAWHFIFSVIGLYDSKRLASFGSEAMDIVRATLSASVVLLISSALLHFQMVTLRFVAIFWLASTILLCGSRFVLRTCLRHIRTRGRNSRNMLIVGSNQRAIEFARTMQTKPEMGYRIVGFADEKWAGVDEVERNGWSLVCDFEMLRMFLRRNIIDEVVIALPFRSFHNHASDIASMCHEQGIILRVLSDLFNLKNVQPKAEEFEGSTMITHFAGIAEGWPRTIKRSLDFALSLVLLVVLSPVLVMTALLIKLTSSGPALFRQKRVGLNKRIFDIYKFRTMVVDAEDKLAEIEHLNEVSGPVFKIKNDPRITPVGMFLRKTSIDELPQLFNVLKGDMSLVGPRPLQLRDYELFTEGGEDWQRYRFSVRPGITCLWQVNGRSALPFYQWMELDLQYIRTWSLWLDVQILAKTIPAVLRGSGAA